MKTLLIDNYDSFTFNLFQVIAEVNRTPPIVVRNDSASWNEIKKLDFDNIVISPGPGRPENSGDFGICKQAILEADVPIFGVCLGHQGICYLFGGEVDYADQVMHGRSSDIYHTQEDIFQNIPTPYSAVRYHSLHVTQLPLEMKKLAWTEDNIIMAAKHNTKPIWSVQFHPESIKTQYGHQLLENFRLLTADWLKQYKQTPITRSDHTESKYNVIHYTKTFARNTHSGNIHGKPFKIHYRRIPLSLDAENVFLQNFANSEHSFWLDSALVRGFSRFSYMGDASGPHAEYLTYRAHQKEVRVQHQGQEEVFNESVFDYLDRILKERFSTIDGLPFDFNLGYAGYFGYELKNDCGYESPYQAYTPDAAFVFADRAIAFDHEENIIYLLCLDDIDHDQRAEQWLKDMYEKLLNVPEAPHVRRALHPKPVKQTLRHSAEAYLERIKLSQAQIKKGETYEVCLTNMITQHVDIDPLNTYRALRHSNPAPYATYLKFPEASVLSSSPERFITVDAQGIVESKPIKGTRRRGKTSEEDEALYRDLLVNEKDRSEKPNDCRLAEK